MEEDRRGWKRIEEDGRGWKRMEESDSHPILFGITKLT
jgi:hypothetical protein